MDKYYGEWDIKIIGFYGSYNAPYEGLWYLAPLSTIFQLYRGSLDGDVML
jgi:hypothetical protein